jgi:GDP/UDP-N,N'-diacetylbacillosamine 2-epimerase (hydrolysing)
MRKICVVTGSRAEYGLLRWVIGGIRQSDRLQLQLVVTGSHLSPVFGHTYREIEADGFQIERRIDMLLASDTAVGITKSMGLALVGFADAFEQLAPDVVVVLGDRYEILCAATAALMATIPVAHLHGGETSEGAYDEMLRHAITKMSHLHFVAAEPYRRRVVQMGEDPGRVFVVGGLGVDVVTRLPLLGRAEVEAAIGVPFLERNLLITFHPVTLGQVPSAHQVAELLAALEPLVDTRLIFTMPNADAGGRELWTMVQQFAERHANAIVVESLGQLRYLSCVAQVDAVVGNSSSGLTEVPSMRKATINIGERQRGRLRAESVIDCSPDRLAIGEALRRACSPEFGAVLSNVRNPYGDGGASEKIVATLRDHPLGRRMSKSFHDLPLVVES